MIVWHVFDDSRLRTASWRHGAEYSEQRSTQPHSRRQHLVKQPGKAHPTWLPRESFGDSLCDGAAATPAVRHVEEPVLSGGLYAWSPPIIDPSRAPRLPSQRQGEDGASTVPGFCRLSVLDLRREAGCKPPKSKLLSLLQHPRSQDGRQQVSRRAPSIKKITRLYYLGLG